MANLRLENVTKRFGPITAVKALNLEIRDGEFFSILGPPGAGKTTTLRLIVGLEKPNEGTIYIDGEPANEIHPGKRDIAMVFQNLALYPDKTVFDNMAYPLRERKLPKDEIDRQVRATAKSLYIEHLLARKPAKLSGGERQRVAIGRAMVRNPKAYLLDEPLANLDALLRLEMRVELKRLQGELGQTLVYVTHDQVEAMSMADRIAVLNKGVLQQCDTPETVYNFPANRFVATTIGSPPTNFVTADVRPHGDNLLLAHSVFALAAEGGRHPARTALESAAAAQSLPEKVVVGIRPEDVRVSTSQANGCNVPAQVLVVEPLGGETVVDLRMGNDLVKAVVPPTQRLEERRHVWLNFDPERIHLFDARTGQRIYTTGQAEQFACLEAVH